MATNGASDAQKAKLREQLGAGSAFEVAQHLNILVQGDAGAGKTYFGGTAQDHELTAPLLVLDMEGGTTTLRHRKDVDVKRCHNFEEFWAAYELLEADAGHTYKTVLVDSLTELQKMDLTDIMVKVVNKDSDRDPDVPSMREWGKTTQHIRNVIRRFRDLPCNVVFTVLSKREKDNEGNTVIIPDLPGKLAWQVPGFVDIVGYLYADVDNDIIERRMQFQPTRKVMAKDRTAALGAVLINPTVSDLLEKIINSNTTEATKG